MTHPAKMYSINPDSFIYAVHQAFEARTQKEGKFNSHLRYTPFLMNTWEVPTNPDLVSFKQKLAEIISHHYSILPQYQRNETITLENVAWFAHSTAVLLADIEYLFKSYAGSALPKLGEVTELPIAKEVWGLVTELSRKTFRAYFDLISTYITWKYSSKETENVSNDWNVRPPCGALYRKEFKEFFDQERDEKRGHKKRDSFKPQRNETPKFDNSAPANPAPVRNEASQVEKPVPPQFPGLLKREQGPRNNQVDPGIAEAEEAVQTLNKHAELNEVNLRPQNSFVRRQQHVVLAEAGFDTESCGEANGRYVSARRKK